MSIFPFIEIEDIQASSTEPLPMYREIAWDYENNKPVIENGEFKIVEGNEAIRVWIYKTILTNRFEYEIYSWDYGTEIMDLIGKNYTKNLVEAELKRFIEEALIINPYIIDVNVLETSFKDSLVSAKVQLKTIYEGDVIVNV